MSQYNSCFICCKPAKVEHSPHPPFDLRVECERCSNYQITRELVAAIDDLHGFVPQEKRYIFSGILRQQKDPNKPMILAHGTDFAGLIQAADVPADPIESTERLLLYIYNKSNAAGSEIQIFPEKDYPLIFSKTPAEFAFLLEHIKKIGWIEPIQIHNAVRLSMDGWKQIPEIIKRRENQGRFAFMAMQYNNKEQDIIFKDYFVPAVRETGFDLKLLKDLLGAGLIDNQLRVQIRRAKFLLADLTKNNLGAYWEAGYAEGLGKQVIYLCKKSQFDEMKTHFDTNHHTTILWDSKNMAAAINELKATIRATFPFEAKMIDD